MLTEFLRDEKGATAIEYGLILSLVFLAAVTGIQAFSDSLNDLLNSNSTAVDNVMGGGIGE